MKEITCNYQHIQLKSYHSAGSYRNSHNSTECQQKQPSHYCTLYLRNPFFPGKI